MRMTEEFKVMGIIMLTLVLLVAFCLSTSDILALLLVGLIAVILGPVYTQYIKKDRVGPVDERSERISLVASRNGFLAIILLLTFGTVISRLYPSQTTIGDAAIIAWGLGIFVYLMTYIVGIRNP